MQKPRRKTPEFINFRALETDCEAEYCFVDNEACGDKIIDAHSITKGKILKKIAIDRHVLTMDGTRDSMKFQMVPVGVNEASVFKGFCNSHDSSIFRNIDVMDYQPGNQEQEFLFAYRAIAKEYHTKVESLKMTSLRLSAARHEDKETLSKYYNDVRFMDNPELRQQFIEGRERYLSLLNAHMDRYNSYRNMLNHYLSGGRYDRIRTYRIQFDGEYPVSVSSIFQIIYDTEGNLVYNGHQVKPIILTVFPQNGQTHVLISFFAIDNNYLSYIDKQIVKKDEEYQKRILSNMICCYVENFYISPRLWHSFDNQMKMYVCDIFNSTAERKPRKLGIYKINLFTDL